MKDKDIRKAFHKDVIEKVHGRGSIVIDEFNIGKGICRADIVVIDKRIHGYEIKSEKDNLSRLTRQVNLYNRSCELPCLVVHESHYQAALKIIDPWWAVHVATGTSEDVKLEKVREGWQSELLDPRTILMYLWKRELMSAMHGWEMTKYGHAEQPYHIPGLRYRRAIEDFAIELFPEQAAKIVVEKLKERAISGEWTRNYTIL